MKRLGEQGMFIVLPDYDKLSSSKSPVYIIWQSSADIQVWTSVSLKTCLTAFKNIAWWRTRSTSLLYCTPV